MDEVNKNNEIKLLYIDDICRSLSLVFHPIDISTGIYEGDNVTYEISQQVEIRNHKGLINYE